MLGYIFSGALRCFFHCDGFLGVFCNRNRIFLCNISGFYGNIAVSFFCLQCVYTVLCFQLFAVSIFQCDYCICRICFQCQFLRIFFSEHESCILLPETVHLPLLLWRWSQSHLRSEELMFLCHCGTVDRNCCVFQKCAAFIFTLSLLSVTLTV